MAFVHLHNHTQYSIQDAVNKIPDCLERVKELGQTACAITDHGVMYGAITFYKKAKELGIKPIIGCEVYLTDKDHKVKESTSHGERYYHLVLLAKDFKGYQNLTKLCTLGFTEGLYHKPRIDYALLDKYHEGLICLSACIAGELSRAILRDDLDEARAIIKKNLAIFGEGNYYLEIQNHGIAEEMKVAQTLYALGKEMHVPLVATNDNHYTRAEDKKAHEALLCIRSQRPGKPPILLSDKNNPNLIHYDGDGYYIKSEEEMRELFPWCEEAIENTAKIADVCNVELTFHETKMPAYPVPDGYTAYSYLEHLCMEGLQTKYPDRQKEMGRQLTYELGVIKDMGFVEYFLIVWDFINWARTHDIPVGLGRGSAVGSVVSYCIGITDVEPTQYHLLFQRFLNPERVSMPDIDTDLCMENRGRVVDYVREKYGKDNVCQIVTFGTFAARQAIKDVGKCMGLSVSERDAFASKIPATPGMTLKKAREEAPEFDALCVKYSEIYDIARLLEGLPRQTGTHAAGVIICDRPVQDYIPLCVKDGTVQSQYNMVEVEELGLLKMDFLGLRTLTAIHEAMRHIGNLGITPEIRYDDKEVFAMIGTGETSGVFQLESEGMQDFMRNLKPTCMEDLVAGVALYRPGPIDFIPDYVARKHDPKLITYACPELESILKDTYGCIVYQEQVMQIFQKLAGFSLGRADIVRRAMSKKKASVLEAERKNFIYGNKEEGIKGCINNGISEKVAKEVFASMESFAQYCFNKSHAAAYATVCYQTAWLMHYFPTEYFAALMTSVITDHEKVAKYAEAARRKGIALKRVDIGKSEAYFLPDKETILYALGGITGIGVDAAKALCDKRGDKFTTFRNVLKACKESGISSAGIISLADAGAFDDFAGTRTQYAAVAKTALAEITKETKRTMEGQMSLFDFCEEEEPDITLPVVPEVSFAERCERELSAYGMYVTAKPLDQFKTFAEKLKEEKPYLIPGILKGIKTWQSKRGVMAFLDVETDESKRDFTMFANAYSENYEDLQIGKILLFELDGGEDIVGKVYPTTSMAVRIVVCAKSMNEVQKKGKEIRELLKDEPSGLDVISCGSKSLGKSIRILTGGDFKAEETINLLREHFGAKSIAVQLLD